MNNMKGILICFYIMLFIRFASAYAQPRIEKESIPKNISSDVREEIERLYSEDPVKRAKAANSLGKIGDIRAVEPLIAALKDKNYDVRTAAVKALKSITGQYFGQFQEIWERWWKENKDKILKRR